MTDALFFILAAAGFGFLYIRVSEAEARIRHLREEDKRLRDLIEDAAAALRGADIAVSQRLRGIVAATVPEKEKAENADTGSAGDSLDVLAQTAEALSFAEETPDAYLAESALEPREGDDGAEHTARKTFRIPGSFPIWAGAAALTLAGVFFVRYAAEHSLIPLSVRTALAALFALGLLYASRFVRLRAHTAYGERAALALAGAGFASLYAVCYAASGLFGIIPPAAAMAAAACVTAAAVRAALRYGAPVALIAAAGGYAAPVLAGGGIHAAASFIYLYAVFAGLFYFIGRRRPVMTAPTLAGAYLSAAYIFITGGGALFFPVAAFVCAVGFTVVFLLPKEQGAFSKATALTGAAIALFVTGVAAAETGGSAAPFLYLLLICGGMAVAYVRPAVYAPFPVLAAFATAGVMFGISSYALYALLALQTAGNVFFALRGGAKTYGNALAAIVMMLCANAHFQVIDRPAVALPFLALLAFSSYRAYGGGRLRGGNVFLCGFAFLSAIAGIAAIGVYPSTFLKRLEYVPLFAFAAAAFAALYARLGLRTPAMLSAVFQACMFILLLPAYSLLTEPALMFVSGESVVLKSPVPGMLPAALAIAAAGCFVSAYALLRRPAATGFCRSLPAAAEYAGIIAIGACGVFVEKILSPGSSVTGDIIAVHAVFLFALLCFAAHRRTGRNSFRRAGYLVALAGCFRTGAGDMLLHNPLFTGEEMSGVFLLNTALLIYALPLVWTEALRRLAAAERVPYLPGALAGYIVAGSLLFIAVNLRFLFQGGTEGINDALPAEALFCSFLWLLTGAALYRRGFARRDGLIRYYGIAVLTVTAGKIVFIDNSGNTLYAALSYMMLGAVLVGLHYGRAVISERKVL